ncbi:tetratricopeptide repeat protein [Portibacter marinus]|uniref:tetratricopeptide repeat protein n=1 Tax=Portibacter marinus TaxID=2898660 RepID=UPI001F412EE9|nr:tetratricopeptide repeat protein [Portibacter marinus]
MKFGTLLCFVVIYMFANKACAQGQYAVLDSLIWHYYDGRFENAEKCIAKLRVLIDSSAELGYEWGEVKGRLLLAETYQVAGEIDSVIFYANEGIALSEEYGLKKQTAIGYSFRGRSCQDAGSYAKANIDLQKSLKLFQEIQDTFNIYYTHLDIGWLNMLSDELDSALVHSLKFLNYAEEIKDTSLLGVAYNNMGTIHKKLRNYEKAESFYEQGLQLMNGTKDSEYQHSAFYNNLGLLYKAQDNFKEALIQFAKLEEISTHFGDERGVLNSCINRGSVLNVMERYRDAEESLRKALELAKKLGMRHNLPDINNQLAKSLIGQGKLGDIQNLIDQALRLSREIGLPERAMESYEVLRDYHLKMGNDQKVIQAMDKVQVLKDSLYESQRVRQVNELQEKYEAQRRDSKIQALESEAEYVQKRNRMWLILFGVVVAFVLVSGFLLIRYYRERKVLLETELALEETKKEMAESALASKSRELSANVLQLIKKNQFLVEHRDDLKELEKLSSAEMADLLKRQIHKVDVALGDDEFWRIFTKEFKSVHGGFLQKLRANDQPLSKSELRMVALLKMNLSSKEIANILNITSEGVKKARQRLRKKLEIDSSVTLQEYLINL